MKKTMRYLSMAVLALVGAMTTGCSNDDDINVEPLKPADADNAVTMTTTVSFGGTTATTRAMNADGVKTFAVGEKIAVVYTNTSDQTVKAVSNALTADDIASGSKTATFTVSLNNPKAGGSVKYIYPAAMANDNGTPNYNALATQNGTLASLSSNLDFSMYEGTMTDNAGLPESPTLTNQLAICAFTIKKEDGTNLTNTVTKLIVKAGNDTYTVNRTAAAGPIYVAIRPTSSASINYTATAGTSQYSKSVTGKTYAAGDLYQLGLKMALVIPGTDLSMVDCAGNARTNGMTTANCYMVQTKGDYKLPLVYGNAIKNGADNTVAYKPGGTASADYCTNFVNHANAKISAPWITKPTSGSGVNKGMNYKVTSAELLWQDAKGLITKVGITGDYLTLTVGKNATQAEGNAVIAAKDANGTIVWSWHIWVTKQTFATLSNVTTDKRTYKVAPVYVGFVGNNSGDQPWCSPFYQWGRKDPLPPGYGYSGNKDHKVYNISGTELTANNFQEKNNATIADNIKNPRIQYYTGESYLCRPYNVNYFNLWDAQQTKDNTYNDVALNNISTATKKTIYDPCPPGFCVPTSNLFAYLRKRLTNADQGEFARNRKYTGTTPNLYFPAVGCRGYGTGIVSRSGYYCHLWSASAQRFCGIMFEYADGGLIADVKIDYRAIPCPILPVAE